MRAKPDTKENIASRIVCSAPWRLKAVESLPNYALKVEFIDGVKGIVYMQDFILDRNAGIFAKLMVLQPGLVRLILRQMQCILQLKRQDIGC